MTESLRGNRECRTCLWFEPHEMGHGHCLLPLPPQVTSWGNPTRVEKDDWCGLWVPDMSKIE